MKCFSCKQRADVLLKWNGYRTLYCDGCADSVVAQVENDGFTVTADQLSNLDDENNEGFCDSMASLRCEHGE